MYKVFYTLYTHFIYTQITYIIIKLAQTQILENKRQKYKYGKMLTSIESTGTIQCFSWHVLSIFENIVTKKLGR